MPHRFLGIVLLASILVPLAACRPIGPADIPQVKPDGWVVDLAGLLSPEEIAELERLGDAVHQRDGAALAVVTVQSTAGLDPRALATSTFDLWRLGDAKRDNGILIFVAIDDRAAEIVLGDGIDSDAEVAKSDQIMQNRMVPRFRRMEPNLGILSGARACATQFFGVGGPELEALPLPVRAPVPRPWRMPSLGVLITLGILALAFTVRQGVLFWQRRPRKCGQCRKSMAHLDEVQRGIHLAPGEVVEEKLGSVHYELWKCRECGEVEKVQQRAKYTAFSLCTACHFFTAYDEGHVLSQPSYTAPGLCEMRQRCKACDYESISTVEIPILSTPRTRPERLFLSNSQPSPSRWSSSSSLSSSSSSSPPRSSGGGGSTSGRGSSGRW